MPNRLINETSPYLLQHAHNPVDWYAWGSEALQRALSEDKPILLSIGYSSCHWCHVMERESFENEAIARLMNEDFVCVKVDREEHPDVDHVFMQAVQAMTGSGGWPLTVFLTPQGEPFYGGTYFPPQDARGLPGFPRVLQTVADAYRDRRPAVIDAAQQLVSSVNRMTEIQPAVQALDTDVLDEAYRALAASFHLTNGGFGLAPKFPQPMTLEFLLHSHRRIADAQALNMVDLTLGRMAAGGIYDQVGGGFHRYSTDAHWLVPHFEKMLYDNALLSRLYLHAYQATGNPRYRRIAEETLDYVLREMTDANGGFYSAQDADTEGEEGRYYVWTVADIIDVLGREDGQLIAQYLGATEGGNFEGRNVLHVPSNAQDFAARAAISPEQLHATVERSRPKLLAARELRVRPGRDDKVLTSWNGMMLQSLAEAASILEREDYRRAAVNSASFLLQEMRQGDVLMHSYGQGRARIPGYLDDYALLIGGLLAVHQASFDQRWLEEAVSLADAMLLRFWDTEAEGLFYDTATDHSTLFVRPREIVDSVKPCGGSAAADVLLRLAVITGDTRYEKRAVAALSSLRDRMAGHPLGFGNWLCALDFHLSQPREIAVVGAYDHPDTQALLRVVHSRYSPNNVLVGVEPGQSPAPRAALLQDRTILDGSPTAYVCHHYTCQAPTTDPTVFQHQVTH